KRRAGPPGAWAPSFVMEDGESKSPPCRKERDKGGAPSSFFCMCILLTRSVISAISRMGSTSVWMRLSSPARSRAAIHWRRSSKGKGGLLGTNDYTECRYRVMPRSGPKGGEPSTRLLRRKERDASRGSPGSFAAQSTLAQDDNLYFTVWSGAW